MINLILSKSLTCLNHNQCCKRPIYNQAKSEATQCFNTTYMCVYHTTHPSPLTLSYKGGQCGEEIWAGPGRVDSVLIKLRCPHPLEQHSFTLQKTLGTAKKTKEERFIYLGFKEAIGYQSFEQVKQPFLGHFLDDSVHEFVVFLGFNHGPWTAPLQNSYTLSRQPR